MKPNSYLFLYLILSSAALLASADTLKAFETAAPVCKKIVLFIIRSSISSEMHSIYSSINNPCLIRHYITGDNENVTNLTPKDFSKLGSVTFVFKLDGRFSLYDRSYVETLASKYGNISSLNSLTLTRHPI
jgi:hypothetical protein